MLKGFLSFTHTQKKHLNYSVLLGTFSHKMKLLAAQLNLSGAHAHEFLGLIVPLSLKVFVPPGYGQDVKSWSTAPAGTIDVIKDAPKVTFHKCSTP